MKLGLIMLAMAAALPAASARAQQVGSTLREMAETPVITVRASETIYVRPDKATINVGVQTEAVTAVAALADNSVKMDNVLAAIRAAGIHASKVQTTGVRINAQYDYKPASGRNVRTFRAYQVTNSVRLTTIDVAGLGPLLDKVTSAGGTNISGPYFSVANPDPLRAEARRKALAEADARASAYARERGFSAARLISIDESGYGGDDIIVTGSRVAMDSLAAEAPTPVSPGEVGVSASLSVRYILVR